MARIDAVLLAAAPVDMRSDYDTTMAKVISVLGAAKPHHA
jgi:transposase